MRTKRRAKVRPSKEQVRAWLTTVIAPLVSALSVERQRAEQGNWSFRCETQDFEFLWPIERMVAAPYEPNLEQFLRHRNDLRPLTEAHDQRLSSLRSAAQHAYQTVLPSQRFRALAGTSVSERDQRYFAEYVVNGLRDLPSYYTFHDVWTRDGERFLGLRHDPALMAKFTALTAAGESFLNVVRSLLSTVGTLQSELADTYKLPPVDPADVVRS